MDRLRALGARYLAYDRIDRIAVGVCVVLALCALVAGAVAPPSAGSIAASAPPAGLSPSLAGLELSKELTADHVPTGRPDRAAAAAMPTLEPMNGGAAGLTLLLALPVGVWLGFALARRRGLVVAPATDSGVSQAGAAAPAVTNAVVDEIDHLKRSLKRRDRRIAALKRRLRPSGGDADAPVGEATETVAQLEQDLEQARGAIQRLEELLQDKQDDWARSELITARSDSRVAALEADLRAAGEIIESLHEDIGYWKRRAVESAPRDRVINRLTG